MKTKQILAIITMAVLLCGLASCEKSTRPFVGEYTYQTDGEVTIGLSVEDVDVPWTGMGQMQILKDKDGKGRVKIIKKSLLGDISTYGATISGDEITVDEYVIVKEVNIPTSTNDNESLTDLINQLMGKAAADEDGIKGKAKITVNSTGRLYDNTIIFEENYSGLFYETGDMPFIGTIKSNDLKTIAKLND